MKQDHTFTFTAAVVLAGVILALVNPGAKSSKADTANNVAVSTAIQTSAAN